jgi:formylglycine-generating enzyme required for sulfatase activity
MNKNKLFTFSLLLLYSIGFLSAAERTVSNKAQLETALTAAISGDVIKVAVGRYFLDKELTIKAGVTVIGGFKSGFANTNRIYPGAASTIDDMTVFDGNSLVRTKPAEKHRVATVLGALDGVLVRNGHVRNNNGGGLYIDGGTVQNCIIKGNVAMYMPVKGNDYDPANEAYGGGVYIKDGKLINCVVAYNMANQGYGVAGDAGEATNNTITANTYAPVPVQVKAGTYRHYRHWNITNTLPWGDNTLYPVYGGKNNLTPDGGNNNFKGDDSEFDPGVITLSAFYMAQTEVTTSQYAVFANAVDMAAIGTGYGLGNYISNALGAGKTLADLDDPSGVVLTGVMDGGTNTGSVARVGTRFGFPAGYTELQLFQAGVSNFYGLRKVGTDFVYYKNAASTGNNSRVSNEAMSYVTWFGALAYSLWIGGTIPTEAQWEFAARRRAVDLNDQEANNSILNKNCNVYLFAGSDVWGDVGWYYIANQSDDGIHEVAKKAGNDIGLYDMTGNVWEWCADGLNVEKKTGAGAEKVFYPNYATGVAAPDAGTSGGTVTDPVWNVPISDQAPNRVFRGGGWTSAVGRLSLASRTGANPKIGVDNDMGFRPVLVP